MISSKDNESKALGERDKVTTRDVIVWQKYHVSGIPQVYIENTNNNQDDGYMVKVYLDYQEKSNFERIILWLENVIDYLKIKVVDFVGVEILDLNEVQNLVNLTSKLKFILQAFLKKAFSMIVTTSRN